MRLKPLACKKPLARHSILALACLLLAACASAPDNPNAGRYQLDQDAAPDQSVDVDQLQDAVPRYEPPSRGGNKSSYSVLGKTYRVMSSADGYREEGRASWYGAKFHGHATSNGERFDMYQMSAAHKTLPLPTYLRVTNLENGKTAIVRVNDRGPFHEGRILDLSYAAAKKLGYSNRGTALVRLEAISVSPDGRATIGGQAFNAPVSGAQLQSGNLFIQVAALSDEKVARNLSQQLQQVTGSPVRVYTLEQAGKQLHRVQVGPFERTESAEQAQALLRSNGYTQALLVTVSD